MRILQDIKDAGLTWGNLTAEMTTDEKALVVFLVLLNASIGPAAIWLWSIN